LLQKINEVSVLTNEISQKQIVNHAAKPSHHGKNAQHHHQVLQTEKPGKNQSDILTDTQKYLQHINI